MADLDQDAFRKFALVGAQARLAQLEAERAQILRAFPGLRSGRRGRPAKIMGGATGTDTLERPTKTRRRRTMPAEARKRISDRMKRLWAERRKKR